MSVHIDHTYVRTGNLFEGKMSKTSRGWGYPFFLEGVRPFSPIWHTDLGPFLGGVQPYVPKVLYSVGPNVPSFSGKARSWGRFTEFPSPTIETRKKQKFRAILLNKKNAYHGQNLRKVPVKEAVHIPEGHYQHLGSFLTNWSILRHTINHHKTWRSYP